MLSFSSIITHALKPIMPRSASSLAKHESATTVAGCTRLSAMESLKQNLAVGASTSDGFKKGREKTRERDVHQVKLEQEEEEQVLYQSSEPTLSPWRRRAMVEAEATEATITRRKSLTKIQVKLEPENDDHVPYEQSSLVRVPISPKIRNSPVKVKRKASEYYDDDPTQETSCLQAEKTEEVDNVLPSSSNTSVRRRGGLLTPHASVGDVLVHATGLADSVKTEFFDEFSSHVQEAPRIRRSGETRLRKPPPPDSSSISATASRQGLFVSPTQSPTRSVVRKPSFIRLGEREADSFSNDLARLAEERRQLEENLARVKQSEKELLSLFSGYPVSSQSSIGHLEQQERQITDEAADQHSDHRQGGSPTKRLRLDDRISSTESLSWSQHRDPILDPSGDSYLVWFDLETNDAVRPPEKIRILEVAVCVSDKNFFPLDKGYTSLVHWPLTVEELKQDMVQKVQEMHERTGLFDAYRSTPPEERLTLAEVEKQVCRYLNKHGIQRSRGILAGAGVAFDRAVVRHHMQKLDKFLGYQICDTTSIWQLIRRKYNRTNAQRFAKSSAHRAMDDIIGSMEEARKYFELALKSPSEVQWPKT